MGKSVYGIPEIPVPPVFKVAADDASTTQRVQEEQEESKDIIRQSLFNIDQAIVNLKNPVSVLEGEGVDVGQLREALNNVKRLLQMIAFQEELM